MQKHRRLLTCAPAVAAVVAQLFATAPLIAQDATAQPATTRPARPATSTGGVVQQNGMLTLNFQDTAIDVILDELSSAAGFIVVKEVTPVGRVSLISKQPLTPEDAINLLNTVLAKPGYTAIQQDRILKIVNREAGRRANIPVRSGNDPKKVPNTDELITQVIPLRYSDAQQLKTDLQPLINPGADFTANASSNVLIITDSSTNIRRVVEIVAALDTSVADSVDVKVFQLQHAVAADAAKLINDIFGNLDQARPTGGAPAAGGGNNGGRGGAGGGGAAGGRAGGQGGGFANFFGGGGNNNQQQRQKGKVTAASDDRTNSVVVSGPADTLIMLQGVIKQLDENPADSQRVFVYRLKNAQSVNIEQVLNALFNGTAITNRSTLDNAARLTQARQNSGLTSFAGNTTGGRGATQLGGGGGQAARPQASANAQRTGVDLAGQVNIIADTDSNSLIIRTAPSNWDRVKSVLDEMDKPVKQVLIKVLFAEVSHDNNTDIGAQLSVLNLRSSDNRPNALGSTVAPAAGTTTTLGTIAGGSFGIPTNGAGLVVQLLEQNFSATIRALETAGKLDVLSRPYILASDNQLASITVGQEVPFITNTNITGLGQQINTTEYRDIGILLDVIPHINPDGLVILDVAPEISSLTAQTVELSAGVSQPVIAKRSAQSRVSVMSGQTIVIGGLMQDQLTESIQKVPLLGDIPFLGELFKRTNRTKNKTELLIFLTPHVAAMPDVLDQMGKDEVGGTKLVPDAIAPGVYQEHIRGMQRGEPESATRPSNEPSPMLPPRAQDNQ